MSKTEENSEIWIEAVMALGMIAILVTIFAPYRRQALSRGQLIACKSNMRSLGQPLHASACDGEWQCFFRGLDVNVCRGCTD